MAAKLDRLAAKLDSLAAKLDINDRSQEPLIKLVNAGASALTSGRHCAHHPVGRYRSSRTAAIRTQLLEMLLIARALSRLK